MKNFEQNAKRTGAWHNFLLGIILMAFLGIGALHLAHSKCLYVNHSASLARGLYLAVPSFHTYSVGDVVVYQPPQEIAVLAKERGYISQPDMPFLKKVGAIAADHYEIKPDLSFWVSSHYVGQIIAKDEEGRSMPYKIGQFFVPYGYLLPVSPHPRSLDGRYYGSIPLSDVRAKVIPIFTID